MKGEIIKSMVTGTWIGVVQKINRRWVCQIPQISSDG